MPKGKHWVDMADEGTVVVIEQPTGQTCAAIGGIMATRMKVRGVEACLVGGRVRDLAELGKSGLPVSFFASTHPLLSHGESPWVSFERRSMLPSTFCKSGRLWKNAQKVARSANLHNLLTHTSTCSFRPLEPLNSILHSAFQYVSLLAQTAFVNFSRLSFSP